MTQDSRLARPSGGRGRQHRRTAVLGAAVALAGLGAIVLGTVAHVGQAAAAAGSPVSAKMYYTRYDIDSDINRVKSVDVGWNGSTLTVANKTGVSSSFAAGDGIVFSNDNTHVVVGGQESGNVYRVDVTNGSSTGQSANPPTRAFHLSADPDGIHVWAGAENKVGPLAEYRLDLSAPGAGHALTGDDTGVQTLAWANGKVFYTSSDNGGNGDFGEINLSTFVTTRKLHNLPAAHGMSFDPFSGNLILYGAEHITQIDPTTETVVSDTDLSNILTNHFDQGSVDGKGHIYAAVNSGQFVFIDYSATKRVATGLLQTAFLDTFLDDVIPLSGPGSTPFTTYPGPSPVTVGTKLHDTATVEGGNPSGTVDFRLYDTTDPTCSGMPVFASLGRPLTSNTATSSDYTTANVGEYRWKAHYSGDTNFLPEDTECADEVVTTTKATPRIATTPSAGVPVGQRISDQATVSGLINPDGTGVVTFNLYGPNDACTSAPVFTDREPLTGAASVSKPFRAVAVGTYRWIATYSGDANNQSVGGTCAQEQVTTTQAQAGITTVASSGGPAGTSIHDSATVTGFEPGSTVTFVLYGPNDPNCTGTPVLTSPAENLVNGSATSPSFTPTLAGTYEWMATFSGDATNTGVSGACGLEPVTISPGGDTAGIVSPPDTGVGLTARVGLGITAALLGLLLVGAAGTLPRRAPRSE